MPLVKQQADYIRANTDFQVAPFSGDMNVDSWSKSDWYCHFHKNQVLVMTHQIFLDMLNRGYIKPRQVNLLIFDECHHATKNHPYAQIMRTIVDHPSEDRPKVLGLSASLLTKKVKKPGELKKGVSKLESVLNSTARTSQDLQEVAKYATQPEEVIIEYLPAIDEETAALKNLIKKPLEFLQTRIPGRQQSKLAELAKNLMEDLNSILIDLGPASAAWFVEQASDELRKEMAVAEPDDQWEKMQGCLAMTHFTIFTLQCKKFVEMEKGTRQIALRDSNKVMYLLNTLAKEDNSKLRGIIFVERRYTASCLAKLLQQKSRSKNLGLGGIKCDYVVGHAASQAASFLKKDTMMKSKHQDEVLTKFRKGRINLLVATSVIEEGVDVPKCNLVIRFDLPQNFRAYIQSKGRARDKPSKYLLMVDETQRDKIEMLRNFHALEDELVSLCQDERHLPTEEEIQSANKDLVPPYMPNGLYGARATTGNSLSLLHR